MIPERGQASAAIAAILLDVGGTLWPERWPTLAGDARERVERLRAVPALARLPEGRLLALVAALEGRVAKLPPTLAQDPVGPVRRAVEELGLAVGEGAYPAIRRAICLPARGRVALFPGARELLATIAGRGWRAIAVTNAVWRDGAAYRRDFVDLGVGGLVAGVVSSLDVGARKPHGAPFAAALRLAGCPARAAIMIGNSERSDIALARALGLRTIRVAIEGAPPGPGGTVADSVAGSLGAAAATLREWAAGAQPVGRHR